MRVSLIAAVARNGVIGDRGRIPWRLSDDLRRFQRLTLGHVLVMGRRTFESIGRALPGRRTLVLTRGGLSAEGAQVVGSIAEALAAADGADELFVAGGSEVYAAFLPFADRLLITWVDAEPAGDAYFPEFERNDWRVIEELRVEADARNQHASTFAVYERRLRASGAPR